LPVPRVGECVEEIIDHDQLRVLQREALREPDEHLLVAWEVIPALPGAVRGADPLQHRRRAPLGVAAPAAARDQRPADHL